MKPITFPLIGLALIATAQAGPFANRTNPIKRAVIQEKVAENAAIREEKVIEKLDTVKWKKDDDAVDQRPTGLVTYHTRTLKRIEALIKHGAITEENAAKFKAEHTKITEHGRELKADGEMSEEDSKILRRELHALNDAINVVLKESEETANDTPLLNEAQNRFEEQIEQGVRTGRLSTGEASRLTRKVESLKRLEEREKAGVLSTKDREKLFEEAAELAHEIQKELRD